MIIHTSKIAFPFLIVSLYLQMATAGTVAPSISAGRNAFAANLIKTISSKNTNENVIYSPASIQACLALAFFGADGRTADEMRQGLFLGNGDKTTIASNYEEFIKSTFGRTSNAVDAPILSMANRIYVRNGLGIAAEFNNIATKSFHSQAEEINFADSMAAIQQINSWVESQTNNRIQNLLQAGAVNAETSAVLVNAIYFKALWKLPFSAGDTSKSDFWLNANSKVSVDMMFKDTKFKYGEWSDLDAKGIELPYKDSDLSMLILLPNQRDGLAQLEQKLTKKDLNELTSSMKVNDVTVHLPKFKIEFNVDLKPALKELGMSDMFGDSANFGKLFNSNQEHKISDVKHKAFLEVNEAGSEAAAATFITIVPMSLNLDQKSFVANHPFVFAIRNERGVYFAGHVAKF